MEAPAQSQDNDEPTSGHDKKRIKKISGDYVAHEEVAEFAELNPECHSLSWDRDTAQRPPSPDPAALQSGDLAKKIRNKENKSKAAARRLLLFYYATESDSDTDQRIEWHRDPKPPYQSRGNPEKDAFYALAKEKTTLKEIIDCGLDVYKEEPGNWGRASFVGYCAIRASPLCFLLDKDGENESSTGKSCLSRNQILQRVEEEVSDANQRIKREEDRVQKAVDEDRTFRLITSDRFPSPGEYKPQKYIDFRKLDPNRRISTRSYASIDFVFGVPGGFVFLEVDERQHESYKPNYDMERMDEVMRAYEDVYGKTQHVLWIRFNPDPFRITGEQPKQPPSNDEKVAFLIGHLKEIDLVNDVPHPIQVRYLFYNDDILAKCERYKEIIEKDYYFYSMNDYAPNPGEVHRETEQHALADNMYTGGADSSQESVLL